MKEKWLINGLAVAVASLIAALILVLFSTPTSASEFRGREYGPAPQPQGTVKRLRVQAAKQASPKLQQHPAIQVKAASASIDPNTFIVQPPATTVWK